MAVVVTVAKGYDLGYIWKTQGEAAAGQHVGGYYLNAAQAGEPPGRWWGPGAQALGFAPGQIVERKPYDAVYQQIDPRTGAKLGRARGRYATFADHLARLKAAEPHATAERLIELEREAAQATRQPAAYTDVTVSFSKSISVLHASIRENERRARLAGDQRAAAYWAGREQAFQEILHRANRAALEYLQAWAGVTRTGYHGTRVDGREPGRFEAAGLIVTSWLQGTSRDGDPQDHIHNQIARITRTFSDGKWRALDTASLRAVLGALQAIAATAVECELTRRVRRGVDAARRRARQRDRRRHAGADGRLLHAHRPGAREGTRTRAGVGAPARPRADLARAAVHRQRRHAAITQGQGRGPGRLGRAGRAVGRHARRRTGRHRARGVERARPGRAGATSITAAGAPAGPPSREAQARALAKALVLVSDKHPAWTRHDLLKQLALVMPPETRQMGPQAAQELLLGLAEEALSGRTGEVVCLEAPEWPPLPASLRRELDGRSVYTRPGVARYATAAQLTLEDTARRARADAGRAAPARRAGRAAPRRRPGAARGAAARPRARRTRARRAARAAAGPGRRRLARAHLGPHRRGDHRPGRDRQDPGPGRRRPGLGRAGVRHRHLPERHQRTRARPASRSPRTPPGCSPTSAEGRIPPGSLIVVDEGSMISITHLAALVELRGAQRLQAGARRGPGTARRRRRRRRHDAAGRPARLRPARRTGPVHRRLGTRAPRCGCAKATPPRWTSTTSTAASAAPRPTRPWTRPSSAYVASYLAGPGRPADGRGLGPLPGTVRPDPRRPDPPRPGRQPPGPSGSPRAPRPRPGT